MHMFGKVDDPAAMLSDEEDENENHPRTNLPLQQQTLPQVQKQKQVVE